MAKKAQRKAVAPHIVETSTSTSQRAPLRGENIRTVLPTTPLSAPGCGFCAKARAYLPGPLRRGLEALERSKKAKP